MCVCVACVKSQMQNIATNVHKCMLVCLFLFILVSARIFGKRLVVSCSWQCLGPSTKRLKKLYFVFSRHYINPIKNKTKTCTFNLYETKICSVVSGFIFCRAKYAVVIVEQQKICLSLSKEKLKIT